LRIDPPTPARFPEFEKKSVPFGRNAVVFTFSGRFSTKTTDSGPQQMAGHPAQTMSAANQTYRHESTRGTPRPDRAIEPFLCNSTTKLQSFACNSENRHYMCKQRTILDN
jgi:hypothetical protein